MVQIADTQERWSTLSLASRRVCHDGRVDGCDGREEEGDER